MFERAGNIGDAAHDQRALPLIVSLPYACRGARGGRSHPPGGGGTSGPVAAVAGGPTPPRPTTYDSIDDLEDGDGRIAHDQIVLAEGHGLGRLVMAILLHGTQQAQCAVGAAAGSIPFSAAQTPDQQRATAQGL